MKTEPESFVSPHSQVKKLRKEEGTGVEASHTTPVVFSVVEWVWPTLLTGKDRVVNLSHAEITYILCL